VSGSEDSRFGGKEGEFTVVRSIDMLMEPGAGMVGGNMRVQAGGRFQPMFEIMAGCTVALPIEMIGIVADIVLAGFGRNEGRRGLVFHG
jgi:hypothetical protein